MADYKPGSFASIMRAIYDEQEKRYQDANIEPHPRTYQECVKLRSKIQHAYGLQNKSNNLIAIHQVAEGILLMLRNGTDMQDVLGLDDAKILRMAVQDG